MTTIGTPGKNKKLQETTIFVDDYSLSTAAITSSMPKTTTKSELGENETKQSQVPLNVAEVGENRTTSPTISIQPPTVINIGMQKICWL